MTARLLKNTLLGLMSILFMFCQQQNSQNLFKPGLLWLDTDGIPVNAHGGGVFYQNGTYYWYGEHKEKGKDGNRANVGVRCYTSKDLYHWKNAGVVLKVSTDTASEITKGCIIERPKVIYNKSTGKYVMWFHLELKDQGYNAARTGLAISDYPKGPFHYQRSFRPNVVTWPQNFPEEWKETPLNTLSENPEKRKRQLAEGMLTVRDFNQGQMSRDMSLFVDDDGKAYHIHSAEENYTLHISELTADYQSFTKKWRRVQPGGHNEAPAIFKHNGFYYLITSGCTGWEPNAARLFKSHSIWGPWEFLNNPSKGNDADLTFHSQSTFVLPVQGKESAYIFMADRWNPNNPIDGRYVWLPIQFNKQSPELWWHDQWSLSFFDK